MKKSLSLDDIRVQSFVTGLNKLIGGTSATAPTGINECNTQQNECLTEPEYCDASGIFGEGTCGK